MSNKSTEKVKPFSFTINETGEFFELDYSRATIRQAERSGFVREEVSTYPAIRIPELWFWGFRKNHKNIARSRTDEILDKEFGGLTGAYLERLLLLYNQGMDALIISEDDEGAAKNERVTVVL